MTDRRVRPLGPSDLPDVLEIWQRAFGDPPALVERLLEAGNLPESAAAAELGGRVRSVMFAFEHQRFGTLDGAYLYALCTHPDARGRGLGGAVVQALCRRCFAQGADFVFLCPASASLADWYISLLGMRPMRGFREEDVAVVQNGLPCLRIAAEEYLAARASDFRPTLSLLRTQETLLERGGYYVIRVNGVDVHACAEADGDTLRVIELGCPSELRDPALGALARTLDCSKARLRMRSEQSEKLLYLARDGGPIRLTDGCDFFFTMD